MGISESLLGLPKWNGQTRNTRAYQLQIEEFANTKHQYPKTNDICCCYHESIIIKIVTTLPAAATTVHSKRVYT